MRYVLRGQGHSAAQISGFGVYLLGSTVLGAINGALGLGLGFGAFTGLSSLISTVIGPIGWASLGVSALMKLAAPNYKKLLPVVIFIAAARALTQQDMVLSTPPGTAPEKECFRFIPAASFKDSEAKLESDLVQATAKAITSKETERKKKPSKVRVISKHERDLFNLKPENKIVCDIAKQFGGHFLDFPEADQAVIRELANERKAVSAVEIGESLPSAKMSSNAKAKKPCENSTKRQRHQRWRKHFMKFTPNLEFSNEAIDRFCHFEKGELVGPFENQFMFLNNGFRKDKHHVPGTDPKIFQRDCGPNGRIYYRRIGPDKVYVELIGDKNSQPRDLESLRSR
jgi:hypothetical protein